MLLPIGLVQMRCSAEPRENLDRALAAIEAAAASGARLVCLQEMFRSPYPCQSEDPARFEWAEPIPGPSTEAIGKLAAALGVAVVASLFERRAAGVYHNTAAVIENDGSIAGRYRKMHIPDDPLYYEKFYFAPGRSRASNRMQTAPRGARSAPSFAGTSGFPRPRRLTAHGRRRRLLLYPTAIGWQFDEGEEEDAYPA